MLMVRARGTSLTCQVIIIHKKKGIKHRWRWILGEGWTTQSVKNSLARNLETKEGSGCRPCGHRQATQSAQNVSAKERMLPTSHGRQARGEVWRRSRGDQMQTTGTAPDRLNGNLSPSICLCPSYWKPNIFSRYTTLQSAFPIKAGKQCHFIYSPMGGKQIAFLPRTPPSSPLAPLLSLNPPPPTFISSHPRSLVVSNFRRGGGKRM